MARSNLDVVRAVLDTGLSALSPEEISDLFDPEVHLDMSRRVFNPATYDGYEGLDRFAAEVHEVWLEFRTEPERFAEAGDLVAVIGTRRGRARESGIEVESTTASLWTLRDGRIVRVDTDMTPDEALQAAGAGSTPDV